VAVADLIPFLEVLVAHQASDVHLKVGAVPHVRVDGRLVPMTGHSLTSADLDAIGDAVVPPHRRGELAEHGDIDFAIGVAGLGRFRVNVHRQRGSFGVVVRRVPPGVPAWSSLGLPDALLRLADTGQGLLLVTGPAASGRTTTAASLVEHVNASRVASIVTIEDPIEYLHRDQRSIVSQREVGADTSSFAAGVMRLSRHDADVVYLSDLPDAGTVRAAVTSASSGHLVIAVMPASSVTSAVARITDMFPDDQRGAGRQLLATSLAGVVNQRLLDRADGTSRTPVVELLVNTPRSAEAILHGRLDELATVMGEGQYHGMQTLQQDLVERVRTGAIQLRDALAVAPNPEELRATLTALANRYT
jgi:twitching motility protein PilT